ncbi:MAG: GHMP kinase [Verrucomicrobia bacterium]|nr:GHMP kinase [Verrucomicrobiota bacterium]
MSHDNTLAALRDGMVRRFGVTPDAVRFVRAPYRICPLGAHIDHQLGTVTAMAIDRGVHLAFVPSGSGEVRLRSLAFPGEVRFRIEAIPPKQPGDWGNYARGAAMALSQGRKLTNGIVGLTSGDLAEVGLSSSASIGLAYLLALEEVNEWRGSATDNIRLDQAIENRYLGLNNGILDQSAILLSRRDHLTVIDCRAFAGLAASTEDATPGVRLVARPPTMPAFAILIAFSGLTQSVISTDYNRRVTECAEAARLLLNAAGRPESPARLAEVSPDEYAAHRRRLTGPLAKRAEHFFSEMERVGCGVRAWERGDLAGLGKLVTESGRSSIVNYECGCQPMIDLYEILVRTEGVLGARFSGAGFRGCCVALVEADAAEAAAASVAAEYKAGHPDLAANAGCFISQSADGARLL